MSFELKKIIRRENDFTVQKEKMASQIADFKTDVTNLMNKVALTNQVVNYLKNVTMIQNAINF